MADVLMEYKGKQKRIPADKVDIVIRAGGRVVSEPAAPAPAPAEEPSMWERAREGVKGLASGAVDLAKRASQTQQDAGAAALRGMSLGLDDEIAALAARAGATVQRQRDSDAMVGAGGGEGLLESWRATAPLGDEARQERRAEVAAAKMRSPTAAPLAEAGGALVTGLAAPGAQGGRLAQVASAGLTGAIGGAGMGDAATAEDIAADAALGGALGAGLGALVPAAGSLVGRVLRARGAAPAVAPAVAPAGPGFRASAADMLEEVAAEGPVAVLRKKGLQRLAGAIRPKAPAPVPEATASPIPDLEDEAMALAERLRPTPPPAPVVEDVVEAPIELVTRKPPPASAPMAPAVAPDDVMTMPGATRKPMIEVAPPPPAPPPPATGPAGEVLTDLRRDVLGRLPTQEEIRRAIEAVAIREGTTDIATLSSKIGLPTTKLRDVLVPMMRDFQFRQAVAAAKPTVAPASSALDEAAEAGRTIREAQQGARSPIDNVSGRPVRQVAAVQQQERWRAAYDALPTEQRAAFIEQLRRESGLPDDIIRQRLKMTKAEWRRTSFTRSQARDVGPATDPMPGDRPPVLRRKRTAPPPAPPTPTPTPKLETRQPEWVPPEQIAASGTFPRTTGDDFLDALSWTNEQAMWGGPESISRAEVLLDVARKSRDPSNIEIAERLLSMLKTPKATPAPAKSAPTMPSRPLPNYRPGT